MVRVTGIGTQTQIQTQTHKHTYRPPPLLPHHLVDTQTLWDMPPGWSDGEPAKGKIFGRWTECVGVDGAYFWDPKTNECVWEIPEEEMRKITEDLKEIKQDKAAKQQDKAAKQQVKGTKKKPEQPVVVENVAITATRTPSPKAASGPAPKRASVVMREKQLADIRHEREMVAKEKMELERLRKELIDLKEASSVKPAGGGGAGGNRRATAPGPPRAAPLAPGGPQWPWASSVRTSR